MLLSIVLRQRLFNGQSETIAHLFVFKVNARQARRVFRVEFVEFEFVELRMSSKSVSTSETK